MLNLLSLITKAPQSRRTLVFGSAMHIWSDLYFALMFPLLPFIKEEMGLSFTQVALLRSVFTGASGVLQIPAGILAEGMGEFWMLIWGNVWVAAGLVGMAFVPGFVALLVASGLGGLGGGAQHPLASSMVSRAYDDRARSTAVGTVNFAGDIGKMMAPLIAGAVAVTLGWRAAMWIVGLAGAAFMAVSVLARRSVDIGRPVASSRQGTDGDGERGNIRGFVALSGVGFLDAVVRGSALVFLPFVIMSKDMSAGQAAGMLFFVFVGGAAGKFTVGWLGDRFSTVSLIWGTKGLTALALVASLAAPPVALVPLMIVLGIGLNGTSSVLYATVAEFIPPRRRARLYGLYYTTNEIGTILAPIVYGVIADAFSLELTILVMGMVTASILPASLTLRRHLAPRTATAKTGGA